MSYYKTADPYWYELLKNNAKRMRKNPTDAELVLWNILKANAIGFKFRRQHIIQDFIVDFACIDKRVTIEVDGKYHLDPEQLEYDKYRTETLNKLGYKELRFTNEELLYNPEFVIQTIKEVCCSQQSAKCPILP